MTVSPIETELEGVVLRRVEAADADVVWRLLVANRDRLPDWHLPEDYPVEQFVTDYVEAPPNDRRTYGIWEGAHLHGTISLTPARPPHWAVGYFLDRRSTGRGLATAACRAVAAVARQEGAVDLYAIVRDGNAASCAVLQRAGYVLIEELPATTRWWLPLVDDPIEPIME